MRALTGGREPCCEQGCRCLDRAVCVAAEAIARYGEGSPGGFSVGSFRAAGYGGRRGRLVASSAGAPGGACGDGAHIHRSGAARGFRAPRPVGRVRFERVQEVCADAHRSADAGSGTLFVDASLSHGAFEVPAGSRVQVRGCNYLAARVKRVDDAFGRPHHWEINLE